MGNEIAKLYDVQKQPTASGGTGFAFVVFDAVKKSSGESASIFILKKDSVSKKVRDHVLPALENEIKVLSTLHHPRILKVLDVFPPNKRTIAFATERVQASLANVFGNVLHIDNSVSKASTPSTFEVQVGLMQLSDAVHFLHEKAGRIHGNIAPETVFVTEHGHWKLGGFGYSKLIDESKVDSFDRMHGLSIAPFKSKPKSHNLPGSHCSHRLLAPNIMYSAPESVNKPCTSSPASDVFSLGNLIYDLYVELNGDSMDTKPSLDGKWNYAQEFALRGDVMMRSRVHMNLVPDEIQRMATVMMNQDPSQRPAMKHIVGHHFFHTEKLNIMRTLEAMVGKTPAEKEKIFNVLPPKISTFPMALLRDTILDIIVKSCDRQTLAAALPSVMIVAEKVDAKDFQAKIESYMTGFINNGGPKAWMIILENLEMIVKKVSDDFLESDLSKVIFKSFEAASADVNQMVVDAASTLMDRFGTSKGKRDILPRLMRKCADSPTYALRTDCLAALLEIMDNHEIGISPINEFIFPALEKCLKNGHTRPQIVMKVLAVLKKIATIVNPLVVAKKVVPMIMILMCEVDISKDEFDSITEACTEMINTLVKARHKRFDLDNQSGLSSSGDAAIVDIAKKKKQDDEFQFNESKPIVDFRFLDDMKRNETKPSIEQPSDSPAIESTNVPSPLSSAGFDFASSLGLSPSDSDNTPKPSQPQPQLAPPSEDNLFASFAAPSKTTEKVEVPSKKEDLRLRAPSSDFGINTKPLPSKQTTTANTPHNSIDFDFGSPLPAQTTTPAPIARAGSEMFDFGGSFEPTATTSAAEPKAKSPAKVTTKPTTIPPPSPDFSFNAPQIPSTIQTSTPTTLDFDFNISSPINNKPTPSGRVSKTQQQVPMQIPKLSTPPGSTPRLQQQQQQQPVMSSLAPPPGKSIRQATRRSQPRVAPQPAQQQQSFDFAFVAPSATSTQSKPAATGFDAFAALVAEDMAAAAETEKEQHQLQQQSTIPSSAQSSSQAGAFDGFDFAQPTMAQSQPQTQPQQTSSFGGFDLFSQPSTFQQHQLKPATQPSASVFDDPFA